MKRLNDWVPAPIAMAATAAAVLAFAAHLWQAATGAYLSYVSGIWLAMGYDLAHGVFYRDLLGPLGYGGTRYFPLFFTLIAAFLKAGVSPLIAGYLASAVAAAVLAAGLARVARAVGAPRSIVWLSAAGALVPYFVQQTLFEVRADVLAAGLNLLGLAAVIPMFLPRSSRRPRVGAAAAWFILAFATKVTSLTVPGCVGLAMLLSGRIKPAVRLAGWMTAGGALFLAVVHAASGGRAIGIWQACMMMDASENQTYRGLLSGAFLSLVSYSHLLTATFALVAAALAAFVVLQKNGRDVVWLPLSLFGGVTAATALTLSSPGTVASNQVVEWIVVSLALLVWVAAARRELRGVVSTAFVLLVLWMSAQDGLRAAQLWQRRASRTTPAVRAQIVNMVSTAATPALSESALWPTLADQHPYMLDPFALRVVMLSRPDIAGDLASRIRNRYFSSVIFQVDPTSRPGRGYYEHVNFGWPITSLILENYRFDSRPASDAWIYVPKGPDER